MRDALGSVQSVLVLGGNSEIALAIVDKLVASRCTKVLLGVRSPASASGTINRLRAAGIDADTVVFDALDPASHTKVIEAAVERIGDLDMVILGFGILDGHAEIDTDPMFAARVVQTNFVGAVSAGLASAVQLRKQGHGTILSITSVAGVRARAENMIYAASKAGMICIAQRAVVPHVSVVPSPQRGRAFPSQEVHASPPDVLLNAFLGTNPPEPIRLLLQNLRHGVGVVAGVKSYFVTARMNAS